jgi:uncharacterized protein with HEPN domain
MQRDDSVFIHHIIDAAQKALHFIKNREREDLNRDEMLSISLVHLLEIVGEAANGVSENFREQHTHIPWKKMIGLRNRLIHGYFDINLDIVWDTVMKDLPPLITDLAKLVPPENLP